MLRASAEKYGEDLDLNSVIGTGNGTVGVAHEGLLLAYAEAVLGDDEAELGRARAALVAEMGEDALVDAAGTVASFNSIVRVADATGIPIEDFKEDAAREILDDLGMEDFHTPPAAD